MYTGKTEKPCCLCDDPETVARIDLPARALATMKHGDPIAWQDVIGEVSIHFCENDWDLVKELVLETGMNPLPRCNAARASFDLRTDFEALLNEQKERQDHDRHERELLAEAEAVFEGRTEHEPSERAIVEAALVKWTVGEGADQRGDRQERSQHS